MRALFILCAFFIFFSCTDSVNKNKAEVIEKDSIIAKDGTELAASIETNDSITDIIPDTSLLITEHVSVMFTTSYCGGAAPTEEIENRHANRRPFTKSTLRIKNSSAGIDTLVSTNESGEFKASLPVGTYDVYLTSKVNSRLDTGFNPACEILKKKISGTFTVSHKKNPFSTVIIHFDCDPCDPDMKKRP
jgi:hypothetical protein